MSEESKLPAVINLPSVIDDTMPVARQVKHALSSTDKVTEYTRLVPADLCRAVIPEIESRIIPIDRDTAAKKAWVLLGCYPPAQTNKLANQEVYIRGIIAVFEEVPKDIADAAIQFISGEKVWLPARAEVRQVCQQMLNERKRMLWNAKAHLAEHERRRTLPPPAKFYADLTDKEKAAHDERMRLFRESVAGAVSGMRAPGSEANERQRAESLKRDQDADGVDAEDEEAA